MPLMLKMLAKLSTGLKNKSTFIGRNSIVIGKDKFLSV